MNNDEPGTPWNKKLIVRDILLLCCVLGLVIVGLVSLFSHHSPKTPAKLSSTQQTQQKPKPPKPYEFPGGGRTLFPAYRLVALYGTPGNPILGVLGEQSPDASVKRIKTMAAQYQKLSTQKIYPTFEIITTIASATPTDNGDYSQELDPKTLMPWIASAQKAGVYVVLDLQPGRSDFLKQAKQYQALLKEPNVGLALDPEWRLGPTQIPLQQIGSVTAQEVNATSAWLADLTKSNNLPQKLFLLHQFRVSMLPDRTKINTADPNLVYVIQMDGQGTQAEKQSTWKTIMQTPPPNIHFGWKNFVDEDHPMLTPPQTMQVAPAPWYISYQ